MERKCSVPWLRKMSTEELLECRATINRVLSDRRSREPQRTTKVSKVREAFNSIPTSPVLAEKFALEHGVSLAVLRQRSRFDLTELQRKGQVHVKKLKRGGDLYIWRGAEDKLEKRKRNEK